jgi:hypothetical protein
LKDDNIVDRLEAEGLVAPEDEGHSSPQKPSATVQPAQTTPPPLAYDLRILDRFKVDLRRCGVVGEERNGATAYLSITSRFLPKPVSVAIKGDSSSGKSHTVEQTVRFFPPTAVIVMTAMSERALIYMKEDYKHRTLILYEAVALREGVENNLTAYFVRSLLSEGRVDYPVTVRDKDGNWTTKTIVKEGPTNIVLTTTATRLHGENETRLLSLPTNDSQQQTREVLLRLADEPESPDLGEWHQLQQWLRTAKHQVAIPYARSLAEQIPPVAVRLRRDFTAILNLIRAHAILHQLNRGSAGERIVASVDDYEVVRDLVADLIADGVEATVSPTVRETIECVRQLAASSPDGVQVVAVAKALNLDKSAALRRVRTARERGYLENLEDRRGRPGRYVLGESLPKTQELLPQPETLQPVNPIQSETAGQSSGCTVAGTFEGRKGEPEEESTEDNHDRAVATLKDAFPSATLVPNWKVES